jgi:transposase
LELFPDEAFAELFPSDKGRPSLPAPRIASVMVLQALERLSDREANEQVRLNLVWKMALGLPLDDEGFHPSVLT